MKIERANLGERLPGLMGDPRVAGRGGAGALPYRGGDRSDDILMFDVTTVRLEGMSAYQDSWREMFPWLGEEGRFKLSDLEVCAGEDVAFASAILHCAGSELLRDGAELTIRLTVGFANREGRWIVTHEHHSEASDELSEE